MLAKLYIFSMIPSRFAVVVPVVFMAAIPLVSSMLGEPAPIDLPRRALIWASPNLRDLLHIPIYAVFAWLWYWALRPWLASVRTRLIVASAMAIGFGILDEWHQAGVSGRDSSLTDVAFNTVGATLGLWLIKRSLEYRSS